MPKENEETTTVNNVVQMIGSMTHSNDSESLKWKAEFCPQLYIPAAVIIHVSSVNKGGGVPGSRGSTGN